MSEKLICTIWVCQCCALSHANGECCSDDEHGGDGIEPWAIMEDDESVTMGLSLSYDEHECDDPAEGDCDCETITYSTSPCEGCGSRLYGERHAFALWQKM